MDRAVAFRREDHYEHPPLPPPSKPHYNQQHDHHPKTPNRMEQAWLSRRSIQALWQADAKARNDRRKRIYGRRSSRSRGRRSRNSPLKRRARLGFRTLRCGSSRAPRNQQTRRAFVDPPSSRIYQRSRQNRPRYRASHFKNARRSFGPFSQT